MNSIFLTGKAACLTHPVFSSLGTTRCRNTRRREKRLNGQEKLLADRVLAQKNIFIQAQHLPPLYYCVIFHSLISNKVMVSAFQLVEVSRSSVWAEMPSKIQPWTHCFLKCVPARHTRDEKVEQGVISCVICESFPIWGHAAGKETLFRGKTATLLLYQSSLA